MEPMIIINKDMCGAKLLLTTVFAHPMDCAYFCDLLKTQHFCLSSNGKYNPPPTAHPTPMLPTQPFMHSMCDTTVAVKKLLKIQQC